MEWIYIYIFDYNQLKPNKMRTQLTITVAGNKAGELVYFTLDLLKANFLKVVEMEFNTVQDVLNAEKNGHFIVK